MQVARGKCYGVVSVQGTTWAPFGDDGVVKDGPGIVQSSERADSPAAKVILPSGFPN